MKLGIKFLTGSMNYKVPDQDLSIGINKFPAFPKSRLVIEKEKGLDSEIIS